MSRQNGISIEDMLKLDIMSRCNLIAGTRGVRNTISKVNIMADPDILDWIAEGEFLLTTAYFFKRDNIDDQKQFIRTCVDKRLAGIGIKISPYLPCLSPELIDFANYLNFPIVDIHQSIPLSDIMMVIFNEIFNKQASLLQRIEMVHEKLMNVMLQGKGIEDIVRIIHDNLKNPVILNLNYFNRSFEFLEDGDESIREELLEEIRIFNQPNNIKNKLKKLDEDTVLINDKYVKRMIMPIVLRDNIYGHLFTWSTAMPLGGFDLAIIESASTTISLSISQELSIKEVEIRYRSDFFEDLVSTDTKRRKKAFERARFFNLKEEDYYIVEVMSFKAKGDFLLNKELDIDCMMDLINTTVSTIEELLEYYSLKGIVSTKINGIQILLGFSEDASIMDKLAIFNNKLLKILNNKYKDIEAKMGVGRIYKELENANKSFMDAVRAVRIGKSITNKEIVTYDELGIFKILSQDYLNDELEDFYNTILKPLVDYDDKKATDLVKTLEMYFANNGNLTKISKELYTHYNTVLYRIGRINQITNMNIEDPHDRLNLEIALKIKELLGK